MSKAREWREKAREAARAEAVDLKLPSGMVILAWRPNPLQLAAWGKLPLNLVVAAGGEERVEATDEQVVAMTAFMRDVLVYCSVEPRIVLDPKGEDEIHPREIPEQDWTFIVNWALRVEEVRALEGFRGVGTDAGGGGDGEAVRGEAERAAGDRGRGGVVELRPGGDGEVARGT